MAEIVLTDLDKQKTLEGVSQNPTQIHKQTGLFTAVISRDKPVWLDG